MEEQQRVRRSSSPFSRTDFLFFGCAIGAILVGAIDFAGRHYFSNHPLGGQVFPNAGGVKKFKEDSRYTAQVFYNLSNPQGRDDPADFTLPYLRVLIDMYPIQDGEKLEEALIKIPGVQPGGVRIGAYAVFLQKGDAVEWDALTERVMPKIRGHMEKHPPPP